MEIVRRNGPVQIPKGWANLWRQGKPVVKDVGPGVYVYTPYLPPLKPAQASAQVFMDSFK